MSRRLLSQQLQVGSLLPSNGLQAALFTVKHTYINAINLRASHQSQLTSKKASVTQKMTQLSIPKGSLNSARTHNKKHVIKSFGAVGSTPLHKIVMS